MGVVLIVHGCLVAWLAFRHCPTSDEIGHFGAGLSHWRLQRFELYAVNPPLARAIATFPVYVCGINEDLSAYSSDVQQRAEFAVGISLIQRNPNSFRRLFGIARCMYVPISALGAYICFVWARELQGTRAGYCALLLWCASPTVQAFGATMTPDLPAASLGVAACYAFRNWLRRPSWSSTVTGGVILGLCELTKFTWLVLYLIFPLALVLYRIVRRGDQVSRRPGVLQLVVMAAISIYVVNLGYGFERTLTLLGDFEFHSVELGGDSAVGTGRGNRFRGTWLEDVPVPVPASMLVGIDFQKDEFERGAWSYLHGEHRHGGWWYYYLYAMLVKIPVGTIGLAVLGCCLTLRSTRRHIVDEHLLLLLPPFAVVALVSSQTGFNHHLRYVLPAFPFLFIVASQAVRLQSAAVSCLRSLPAVLTGSAVASSLFIYPHQMSYFNEGVGGPKNGWRHLDFSNIDWGQDLYFLTDWRRAHPELTPFFVSAKSYVPFDVLGLDGERPRPDVSEVVSSAACFPPGWYALGVHQMLRKNSNLAVFFDQTAVGQVGYTTYIYHVVTPLPLHD